jgi:hypothetical protein
LQFGITFAGVYWREQVNATKPVVQPRRASQWTFLLATHSPPVGEAVTFDADFQNRSGRNANGLGFCPVGSRPTATPYLLHKEARADPRRTWLQLKNGGLEQC